MRRGMVLAGRFLLDAEAAAGGSGRVFRARDLTSEALVAVKVLERTTPADIDRFARESRILAELSHPGIVGYIAHDVTGDGELYLVQQWVAGETLAAVLAERGLALDEAVAVVRGVAEALAVAHARGIVHRDIKPENILIVDERFDRPMVVDFGIARQDGDAGRLTRTGTVVGTPGYMSPEQARGVREVDARADVFALGCTLYECLTGAPAFRGQNLIALRTKILLDTVDSPSKHVPEIPEALAELVLRMVEKDPALRPADAGVVAAALAALPPLAALGRRGPAGYDAVPTRQEEQGVVPAELVTVVLAAPVGTWAGEDLEIIAEAHGARVEIQEREAIVMKLRGDRDRTQQAARAARCALALSSLFHGRVAIVVASAPATAISSLVDRGLDALHKAVVRALFAGKAHRDPEILLDETTALLVGDGFDLARGIDGHSALLRAP